MGAELSRLIFECLAVAMMFLTITLTKAKEATNTV